MTTKQDTIAHTPEPWQQTGQCDGAIDLFGAPLGVRIACIESVGVTDAVAEANAARIVACVNACATLPDPAVVPELVELLAFTFENYSKGSPAFADRCRAILARCGKTHLAV